MALASFALTGETAGWAIVGCLALFATARSFCSVSYKDVLGKTIAKKSRGTTTGAASTVAGALVLIFGGLLAFNLIPRTTTALAIVLLVASGLWLAAALVFTRVVEKAGATEGGENALPRAIAQFSLLWQDPGLARFIAVRGLLVATSLAPPFVATLSTGEGAGEIGVLGLFITASALSGTLSAYVWGRLADRSSRIVLSMAGLIAALFLGATGAIAVFAPELGANAFVYPALLFGLMIAYQGVRLGRSTHLVDMADEGQRASYTALSNTVIGVVLLAGGLFGLLAAAIGNGGVLLVFAGMSLLAAILALGLAEVQEGK